MAKLVTSFGAPKQISRAFEATGSTGHALLRAHLSAARLADEERPVRRAFVVLPPRHMTAAPRHRQSRSARLRGQLRPSDDRLAPIAGRGHSPAHHPPADHLSASPRAGRSPARHRRRASPRRHASLHLTALRRRRALADRAAAAQAVAAPPRPSPSARACHCRRRRRSTRSPCVVRVYCLSEKCMADVPRVCVLCGVWVWTCHLSLYDS